MTVGIPGTVYLLKKAIMEHHLWVLTHRDLIKSTRIRITTEFLYRELKPFFLFIEAPGKQYCRGCIGARYLEV